MAVAALLVVGTRTIMLLVEQSALVTTVDVAEAVSVTVPIAFVEPADISRRA
jgi:hypothetical protein